MEKADVSKLQNVADNAQPPIDIEGLVRDKKLNNKNERSKYVTIENIKLFFP